MIGSILDITERRAAEDRIALVVDRIAEAVSIVGPDGTHLHVNDAAKGILDDLHERYATSPIGELAWGAVRADGSPVANDALPVEITRNTGREIDEELVGFHEPAATCAGCASPPAGSTTRAAPYTVVTSFADVTGQREAAAVWPRLMSASSWRSTTRRSAWRSSPGRARCCASTTRSAEMFDLAEDDLLGASFQSLTEAEGSGGRPRAARPSAVSGSSASNEMEKRYARAGRVTGLGAAVGARSCADRTQRRATSSPRSWTSPSAASSSASCATRPTTTPSPGWPTGALRCRAGSPPVAASAATGASRRC